MKTRLQRIGLGLDDESVNTLESDCYIDNSVIDAMMIASLSEGNGIYIPTAAVQCAKLSESSEVRHEEGDSFAKGLRQSFVDQIMKAVFTDSQDVFMMVNHQDVHWTLLCFSSKCEIIHYDSYWLDLGGTWEKKAGEIVNVLFQENQEMLSRFKRQAGKVVRQCQMGHQTTGSDCALYAFLYASSILSRVSEDALKSSKVFTPSFMDIKLRPRVKSFLSCFKQNFDRCTWDAYCRCTWDAYCSRKNTS